MKRLDSADLIRILRQRPGLIPIGLDPLERRIIWQDLEQFHFYEGFFHRSLAMHAALHEKFGKPALTFCTDYDALDSNEILTDNLQPSAFIFHAGRCGSTLLTKCLARSPVNLVFGEAGPHNLVWETLTSGWRTEAVWDERNERRYRRLILAMGRRRGGHTTHVIKFTSFNILFYKLIRRAFPRTPALFLYRDPQETLASYRRSAPGWLEPGALPRVFILGSSESLEAQSSPELALLRFYQAALSEGADGLRYLEYRDLTPSNLPAVLGELGISPMPEHLKGMQRQFDYDAKIDSSARAFIAVGETKHCAGWGSDVAAVDARLLDLYQEISHSPSNLRRSFANLSVTEH